MGKLQTFLASAIIGLSPAGGGILNAQTAEPRRPKTEKTEKTDVFAKFRAAEKHALPLLVFFEGCSLKAYDDCNGIATIGIGLVPTYAQIGIAAPAPEELSPAAKRFLAFARQTLRTDPEAAELGKEQA